MDGLGDIPPEEPVDKIEEEILKHDGVVNYDRDLKSAARKIMLEYVVEKSLLKAESLLK